MTVETTTRLAPAKVLQATREFFLGDNSLYPAWLEGESDSHMSFGTFRGRLIVAAFPDSDDPAVTRIRISTLREEGAAPRLLTYLQTLGSPKLRTV